MRASLRILGAIIVVLTLTLTGCTGLVEQVIKDQTGIDVNTDDGTVEIETEDGTVSVGGADFPDDFPADIPVPNGTLTGTLVAKDTWALTYSDVEQAEIDRLTGALEAAGFEQQALINQSGAVQGSYASDSWGVTILWEGQSKTLVYTVAKAG